MEAWHIAQSSRIPSAFFRDFHLLKLSEALVPDDSSTVPNNQISNSVVASKHFSGIDRQYSNDLFAACCRLLHIVLKHHKTEYERCIAILQASVGVLLHCLERVDANAVVRKDKASKDVFGPHCSQFLSNYDGFIQDMALVKQEGNFWYLRLFVVMMFMSFLVSLIDITD
ncbi:hypothetical protein L3X38_011588 [Prunus dulcis]|uniref:Nucleolar 27S pre-rRNA processing Urb2/Npa2 C-terminal domain-containing protein n=1 Tax=Prunus dulcis TaxID=3755 RepID=A0AAD4WKG5_PRUDU|nr:hypothetical protein L3X38_011588 [Prunus dulcis]